MKGVLVDSNVILDVFLNDPNWADWSQGALEELSAANRLFINAMIYAEVSIGFERIEELESALRRAGFILLDIPKEALFLAGKVFLRYKKRQGKRRFPLPDFFIGAQAAVMELTLLTGDARRYRSYFPSVRLISPDRCRS
jgi:predicted nucleic acid-binding protein